MNIDKKTVANDYLGVTKEVKGAFPVEIEIKAEMQLARWAGRERDQRERDDLDNLRDLADYDTIQAENFIKECANILRANLDAGGKPDWVSFYNDKPFPPFVYKEPIPRYELIAKEVGVPRKSFFRELFFPSIKMRRADLENKARQVFETELRQYGERKDSAQAVHEEQRAVYIEKQSEYNKSVDHLQLELEKGRPAAVESFVRIALAKMRRPDAVEVEFDVRYEPAEKLIVVNSVLPSPGEIPRTVRYKYNEEEHGITAVPMKQKDFDDFYESILLQLTFSAVHIILNSVPERHLQRVGFNGWVKEDRSTSCILTCRVTRDTFSALDLTGASLKKLFLCLRGVMAEPLTGLTPVRPIVNMERISAGANAAPKPSAYRTGDFKRLAEEVMADMFDQIENDMLNASQTKKVDIN